MTTTLLKLLVVVADWRKRRNAMRELSSLSDATLRDIGLVRADIPRVVEAAVAADRAALGARQPSRVRVSAHKSSELC
ncbi:MAG: DUF1127 domain-containing protein [Gammaproteobacteria bacterium]|nr:DUF1127 domain-containing protein [Gammaproteobacteria bacterium]